MAENLSMKITLTNRRSSPEMDEKLSLENTSLGPSRSFFFAVTTDFCFAEMVPSDSSSSLIRTPASSEMDRFAFLNPTFGLGDGLVDRLLSSPMAFRFPSFALTAVVLDSTGGTSFDVPGRLGLSFFGFADNSTVGCERRFCFAFELLTAAFGWLFFLRPENGEQKTWRKRPQ